MSVQRNNKLVRLLHQVIGDVNRVILECSAWENVKINRAGEKILVLGSR